MVFWVSRGNVPYLTYRMKPAVSHIPLPLQREAEPLAPWSLGHVTRAVGGSHDRVHNRPVHRHRESLAR